MLHRDILLRIIVLIFSLNLSQFVQGHDDLVFDLMFDSIDQTEHELIVKGCLSIKDKTYSGPLLPTFNLYGIKDKPVVSRCIEPDASVTFERKNGRLVQKFTLDLMDWIKPHLPEKVKNLKIKSFIQKPKEGFRIRYMNRYGGQQIPIAQVTYNEGGCFTVFMSIPLPIQKKPPLQSVEQEQTKNRTAQPKSRNKPNE